MNLDPERVIKLGYLAVKKTLSLSGSKKDGKMYVEVLPANIVRSVLRALLNKGGLFILTIILNEKDCLGQIPSSK